MGDQVAHVVFTPDGRRALAVKFPSHKVAVLDVNGDKVTYSKYDMPVGLWPYNIDVTADGKLALTADNGNAGGADGHVDTVSVIDLEANPPRVIDRVVVGDAPEGFLISPKGDVAVAILLGGAAAAKNAWFNTKRNGSVVALKIDGKKVTKVGQVDVGGLPEGGVFSADGKYLYIGNYPDGDVSILKVDGTTVTDTGKKLKLPGQPASMRGTTR
jgi:DNA-binding beta-propeller fold protein YncE